MEVEANIGEARPGRPHAHADRLLTRHEYRVRSRHVRGRPRRHLLLGGRDADEGLVPAGRPLRRGADSPLRGALRHGRGELDLLPAAGCGARRKLGRADTGGLHDARQGLRADDAASRQARVAPEDLQNAMPVDDRGRVDRPPRELRAEIFRRFSRARRAAAQARQARRDPAPVSVVRRLQAGLARVHRMGAQRSSRATSS